MAHPLMYDPHDPLYLTVRETALAFPGSDEKMSHGRPAFFTTKVFAYFSWSERTADGTYAQHPTALVVLPDADERLALLEEGAWLPPYLGPSGWLAVDLENGWLDRVEELMDMSYRRTASARLVRAWDAARGV